MSEKKECHNCRKQVIGIGYIFNDYLFCGKSCLVRYLLLEEIARIKLIKS